MYPVDCRNCGALNLFLSPPPARVKCDSCGNTFRTDKPAKVRPASGDEADELDAILAQMDADIDQGDLEHSKKSAADVHRSTFGDFEEGQTSTSMAAVVVIVILVVSMALVGTWYWFLR